MAQLSTPDVIPRQRTAFCYKTCVLWDSERQDKSPFWNGQDLPPQRRLHRNVESSDYGYLQLFDTALLQGRFDLLNVPVKE
jgi:hypothetical protein